MLSTDKALELAVATLDNGGTTFHLTERYHPSDGFAVAKYRELGQFVELKAFDEMTLLEYVKRNADTFKADPSTFLGTWYNKEAYTNDAGVFFDVGVYLDTVMVTFDEQTALQQCEALEEASYFDFATMEDVMVA